MSSEARYSITIKINGDLFTVRGDTPEEFATNVESATALILSVRTLQRNATHESETALAKNASAVEVPFPEPVQQAAMNGDLYNTVFPAAAGNFCKHGARNYKEGFNKAGKPYKGWYCPQLSPECPVVWAK